MEYILKRIGKIGSVYSAIDDSKLATIGDVNQLVNTINDVVRYEAIHNIVLTQAGTTSPRIDGLQSNNPTNRVACSSPQCRCTSFGNCSTACCVHAEYNSVGNYTLEIPFAAGKQVVISNPRTNAYDKFITLTRLADLEGSAMYNISTVDKLGIPENGILNDTALDIQIFTSLYLIEAAHV